MTLAGDCLNTARVAAVEQVTAPDPETVTDRPRNTAKIGG